MVEDEGEWRLEGGRGTRRLVVSIVTQPLSCAPSVSWTTRTGISGRILVLPGGYVGSVFREDVGNEARSGDEIVVIVAGHEFSEEEVYVAADDAQKLSDGVAADEGGEGHHDPGEVLGLERQPEHERRLLSRVCARPIVDHRHD